MRFVDPLGTVPGEYYDERGRKIGDDNIANDNVYITDEQTIATNTKDGKTNWPTVQSDPGTVLLPTAETRKAMGDAIQEATPYNEVGGLVATTFEGNEKVLNAKPGSPANPTKDQEATVDVWDLQNPADMGNVKEVKGPFHTHPSGTERVGKEIHSFSQAPSGKDKANMAANPYTGNGYVFGMGDKTVYIYNSGGVIRTVPTSFFIQP